MLQSLLNVEIYIYKQKINYKTYPTKVC